MNTQKIYIHSGKEAVIVGADTKAFLTVERVGGDWMMILRVDEDEFTLFRIIDEIVTGVKMTQALADLETIRVAADFCNEADRCGRE